MFHKGFYLNYSYDRFMDSHSNKDNVISLSNAQERKQEHALQSILQEITHALHHLIDTGDETVIELGSLPCGLECEELLINMLGKGEVNASLTILGCDVIQETSIHGVWWVYHKDDNNTVQSKALYISYIPSILFAQREDVEYSITVIEKRLTAGSPAQS